MKYDVKWGFASAYYFKGYYWESFHFWHMIERWCCFDGKHISYLFSCTEIPCNEIGKSLALNVVKWFECKYTRWRLFKPSKAPASMAEIWFSDKSNLVKVSNLWKARVRIASILLARRLRLIKDSEAPPSWLFSASEGTCRQINRVIIIHVHQCFKITPKVSFLQHLRKWDFFGDFQTQWCNG